MSVEPVVTEYALTLQELAAIDRALFRRTGAYRVVLGLDLALLAALALTGSLALAGVLLAELAGLAYVLTIGSRRRWRKQPTAQDPRRVVIDQDGAHVATAAGDADVPWSAISGIAHIGRIHYLFTGPKTALAIPDRAITPEQRERLARLASKP